MQKYDFSSILQESGRKKHRMMALLLTLIATQIAYKSTAETLLFGAVVFHEVMADPLPIVGLPNAEYVELFNRTDSALSLTGWTFWYDGRGYDLPVCRIEPKSCLLLCSKQAAGLFDPSLPIGWMTSFPSMAKSDKVLALTTATGTLMAALAYQEDWYVEGFKQNGGWSLECVDADNLSGNGDNWSASVDSTGGTPGLANSVSASHPDVLRPRCVEVAVPSQSTVTLDFSESINAVWLSDVTHFNLLSETVAVSAVNPSSPLYRHVELTLNGALTAYKSVALEMKSLYDLNGNTSADTVIWVALPLKPDSFNLSLNELMFNPTEGNEDYIEVVNRSARCVDLSTVWVTSRDENGGLQAGSRLTEQRVPALPGSYWVLSVDGLNVATRYGSDSLSHFLTLGSLPSMPDDAGNVVLVTTDGRVIDETVYSKNQHMALMSDPEGVALEKDHPDRASNDPASWVSASSVSGYGTPGRKNSQFRVPYIRPETFLTVEKTWLTPNGDGQDDRLCVGIRVSTPGTVSLQLYDMRGLIRCRWLSNRWVGTDQELCWDGTDDGGALMPKGRYILVATLTQLSGKVTTTKSVVTVL